MKKIISLSILLIILHSCSKENSETDFINKSTIYCLEKTSPTTTKTCLESLGQLASWHCEVEEKGTISLDQESRCWMPQFELELNSILKYHNGQGDTLNFRLESKSHSYRYRTFVTEKCEDNNLFQADCYLSENLDLKLLNGDEGYDIRIQIAKDRSDNSENFFDLIEISRWVGSESNGIDFKNLNNINNSREEYFERKIIANTEFEDVFSAPKYIFKYYYTQDRGLIGFEDKNNIAWVIVL